MSDEWYVLEPVKFERFVFCDGMGRMKQFEFKDLGIDAMPLSDKARAALQRKFDVGRVDVGDKSYPDVIGARAMDLELEADPQPADTLAATGMRVLDALAVDVNRLADAGLVIGLRSGPDVSRERGAKRVKVAIRVMIAPGRYPDAERVVTSP